jgi:hypothetical protein
MLGSTRRRTSHNADCASSIHCQRQAAKTHCRGRTGLSGWLRVELVGWVTGLHHQLKGRAAVRLRTAATGQPPRALLTGQRLISTRAAVWRAQSSIQPQRNRTCVVAGRGDADCACARTCVVPAAAPGVRCSTSGAGSSSSSGSGRAGGGGGQGAGPTGPAGCALTRRA